MAFIEAFTRFQTMAFRDCFMNVHVSLIMFPQSTGEPKTRPTQTSIRELRQRGLIPDLLFLRSEVPLNDVLRTKISSSCTLDPSQVIGVSDVSNIYNVPILLHEQKVVQMIIDRLKLPPKHCWFATPLLILEMHLVYRYEFPKEEVTIALVGKYVRFSDAYASVRKALRHAAMHANRSLVIRVFFCLFGYFPHERKFFYSLFF
ncbi:unnamed protein product [Enterobius vermicularis]|uniref:CTP_synth_N domain-containing protein n=1 Tax=Enterobius vermicularis TaxID=51028 RepID=A0A0N4UUC7_ENTVE|nr:unnamed protein product [Enterobius vermicularis]